MQQCPLVQYMMYSKLQRAIDFDRGGNIPVVPDFFSYLFLVY
jgi:hypothetical protein